MGAGNSPNWVLNLFAILFMLVWFFGRRITYSTSETRWHQKLDGIIVFGSVHILYNADGVGVGLGLLYCVIYGGGF